MAPPGVRGSPTSTIIATSQQPPNRVKIDIIPAGTVQRIRNETEARIAAQGRETDSVLLRRAHRHARALREMNHDYEERLRVVAAVGLFHMGPSLSQFHHDHDNMRRAITRTNQIAGRAKRRSSVDILTYVNIRIIDIRNRFSSRWVMSTCSPRALQVMQMSGDYDTDISALRVSLADEFVRILTVWGELSSNTLEDHELVNVGPGHDVNGLGQDVEGPQVQIKTGVEVMSERHVDSPWHDRAMGNTAVVQSTKGNEYDYLLTPPSSPVPASNGAVRNAFLDDDDDEEDYYDEDDENRHCSICTESYKDGHRAFCLTRCGHTFGKACISRWVNSTARNANLCPQCRATLCVRRPRRPTPGLQAGPQIDDQNHLQSRLDRATHLFGLLADLYAGLHGTETRNDFFDECMNRLNGRFFMDDLNWIVEPDDTSMEGWRLQGHEWHV